MIKHPLEELEAAVLQLPPSDRAHLAEKLLASLEEKDEILLEWVSEAERRLDSFERGDNKEYPFEQALEKARAGLNRNAV